MCNFTAGLGDSAPPQTTSATAKARTMRSVGEKGCALTFTCGWFKIVATVNDRDTDYELETIQDSELLYQHAAVRFEA